MYDSFLLMLGAFAPLASMRFLKLTAGSSPNA